MNVDEEILRENANAQRRYILNVARGKIADIEFDDPPFYDNCGYTAGGFDEAKSVALEIIDALIKDPNV
jgi:hypothetical protein